MSKILEAVTSKLRELSLEPLKIQEKTEFRDSKKDLLFYSFFVVVVDRDKKQISICFDVRTVATLSAVIALKLSEIKKSIVKTINVDLPFYISVSGKIHFGNEAVKIFEKEVYSNLVSDKITETFLKSVPDSKIPSC